MNLNVIDDLAKLPMVQDGKNIWQNKWHPHDVYGHTAEVVRILRDREASRELLAAGWLHDVGKPPMRQIKEENGVRQCHPETKQPYHSFPGHDSVGAAMVSALPKAIFTRLDLDRKRVSEIVRQHFVPMAHVKEMKDQEKKKPSFDAFASSVVELSKALGKPDMRTEILTIFHADKVSQNSDDLNFLLALLELLQKREGDLQDLQLADELEHELEHLYKLFKSAYGFK